jgi:hypothetical protein
MRDILLYISRWCKKWSIQVVVLWVDTRWIHGSLLAVWSLRCSLRIMLEAYSVARTWSHPLQSVTLRTSLVIYRILHQPWLLRSQPSLLLSFTRSLHPFDSSFCSSSPFAFRIYPSCVCVILLHTHASAYVSFISIIDNLGSNQRPVRQ